MTVDAYLRELRENKKEKPQQVREALGIYIELWEAAIKNKIVSRDEPVSEAVSKLDEKGGLYRAADG